MLMPTPIDHTAKSQSKRALREGGGAAIVRGVDVGDPDGLWKPEMVAELLNRVKEHRAGNQPNLTPQELSRKLGLEN